MSFADLKKIATENIQKKLPDLGQFLLQNNRIK